MTRHLQPDELVDFAEGSRAESSSRHLQSCEICRRQLAELRAAMTRASEVDVPEPSPLFWDHLSARVRERVADERSPRRLAWLGAWSWPPLGLALSIGALAALVLAVAVTMRSPDVPGVSESERSNASAGDLLAPGLDLPLAEDPSLDLVADLTSELDWDAAADAGLTARAGTAERAVGQLTPSERQELQRILAAEIAQARSGG